MTPKPLLKTSKQLEMTFKKNKLLQNVLEGHLWGTRNRELDCSIPGQCEAEGGGMIMQRLISAAPHPWARHPGVGYPWVECKRQTSPRSKWSYLTQKWSLSLSLTSHLLILCESIWPRMAYVKTEKHHSLLSDHRSSQRPNILPLFAQAKLCKITRQVNLHNTVANEILSPPKL